ncbi:MAG: glycosyltransferase [Spirochaetales bacterium]|nr:glycosyltransferase [Spirochaetales bacterium]
MCIRRLLLAMALIVEAGWEICRQLGGIYTVLRSKANAMVQHSGESYSLLGPFEASSAQIEFEEKPGANAFHRAARKLTAQGIEARAGIWLVPGRPQTVLLDLSSILPRAAELRYFAWEHHGIDCGGPDSMLDEVLAFGEASRLFLEKLLEEASGEPIVAHFHEWMGGAAIPQMRRQNLPIGIVFTTHATLLGRYLATSRDDFYDTLPSANWSTEAERHGIAPRVRLERALAHGAHVFTTLSELTALECRHLLGRTPDLLLPNGIHFEHLPATHEVQNLHQKFKQNIEKFVIGHFFPSYTFDLDRTLYFFTSGRYEYRNKGYNVTLDALAVLNQKLKAAGSDRTIIAFLVTRRPHHNFHPDVLASMGLMEELKLVCEAIEKQVGDRLFIQAAAGNKPWLYELVDEYWWLRLKRAMHSWKTGRNPFIITHIPQDENDEVLNHIRRIGLLNGADDPVKIVYHPDFITTTNPLFHMEYGEFVRGCHLGIFPSYYEPWGYTPLESIALGTPAITSDLAGFGNYVMDHIEKPQDAGLYLHKRRFLNYSDTVTALGEQLWNFAQLERRDRIELRNRTELLSARFDWMELASQYFKAHDLALDRLKHSR